MSDVNNLIDQISKNKFDYKGILRTKHTIVDSSKEQYDLKFYLPVMGRAAFVKPCIHYAQEAIKRSGVKCAVSLIECSGKPTYRDTARQLNAEYVFIPQYLSKSGSLFNKSLCYNCGYLFLNKPKWCIFHDIDILVERDYFSKLSTYIKKKPIFIQPYTKKRVQLLGHIATKNIVEDPYNIVNLNEINDKRPANKGSTGGSVVVRSDIFKKVEGYDPEIF